MVYGYVGPNLITKYGHIYFIRDGLGHIKIGIAKNIKKRLDALQTANPNKLQCYASFRVETMEDAAAVEKELHSIFASERCNGEWFKEEKIMQFLENPEIKILNYAFKDMK